jgi:predicted O-methyltransferase YrrM
MLRKLYRKYVAADAVFEKGSKTNAAMEIVYRELFLRDLARLGIADVFYPVGSAANHGLLYFLTRCFTELPIRMAIELGAGESSVLLSEIVRIQGERTELRTVEHDPVWAARVRPRIHHQLVVAELVEKQVDGHAIRHYAEPYFDRTVRYDFVLIDGPPGYYENIQYSRLGALELLTHLATDFVVVVDDAERHGEDVLVGAIRRDLAARGVACREGTILADKRQHIFAAGDYARAAFF